MPDTPRTTPAKCDDAEIMQLWRECGLPEYFLGTGGSNHKLVAFAARCRQDLDVASYELRERLGNAERRLRELGYRRCTSLACNCKGYHRDD